MGHNKAESPLRGRVPPRTSEVAVRIQARPIPGSSYTSWSLLSQVLSQCLETSKFKPVLTDCLLLSLSLAKVQIIMEAIITVVVRASV